MSIRKREGCWHYRFQHNGHEYTGNTNLVATKHNLNRAQQIESKARELVEQGQSHLLQIETVPFSEAASKFLDYCKVLHRSKPNTYKRVIGSFASLESFYGNTPVSSITTGQVMDYVGWRGSEHHVKDVTLRHDLHNLSKFFKYAVKQNWRKDNPVKAEDIPSDEDAVRMHIFNEFEEAVYLREASKFPKLADLSRLMLYQGCRPEEVLSLKVEHISDTHVRIVDGKSKAAKRSLLIREESREIIERLRLETRGEFLFCSERNERVKLSLSSVENWHKKVREITRIPCVIYDWRHTFATRAANEGVSLATLAKILGHGSLRSVMKYVHPDQGAQDFAMQSLNRTVSRTETKGKWKEILKRKEVRGN